jgi:hypothetical protein
MPFLPFILLRDEITVIVFFLLSSKQYPQGPQCGSSRYTHIEETPTTTSLLLLLLVHLIPLKEVVKVKRAKKKKKKKKRLEIVSGPSSFFLRTKRHPSPLQKSS